MLQVKSFSFNPFSENTYIIYNEHRNAVIIDPGMFQPAEEQQLFKFIADEQLNPTHIINTHCHLDHIFGVHACKQQYGIPFAFHALEQPVYDWAPNAGLKYGVPVMHSPAADYYIDPSKPIMLDDDVLQVLFTPGHSPGHISLYNAQSNFVVAGDVIFQNSIGRTDLPGGHFDTLIQSIQQQIFTLPHNTTIYSGHGDVTFVGLEKMNNPYVK
jgi:hydroxyacylglutathione hydrolase